MQKKCLSPKLSSVKIPMKYKIAYHPKLVLTSIHFPIRDSTTVLFYPWELPRNRLLIVSKRLSLGVYRTLLPTRTLRRYPKPSSLVPKNMPSLPPTEKKYQVWARKCRGASERLQKCAHPDMPAIFKSSGHVYRMCLTVRNKTLFIHSARSLPTVCVLNTRSVLGMKWQPLWVFSVF